jgi:ribulose 1,5-bisphosphate synthetase/thiazole synthase
MIDGNELEALKPLLRSLEEAEVVVVGGGTAGFTAAYAAARTGVKTVIVESSSFLGGTTTGGLVTPMMGWRIMRYGDQAEQFVQLTGGQVVGGFVTEFIDRLKVAGGAWGRPEEYTTMVAVDPEMVKIVMERMLSEVGVDIWFLTQFIDALMEGERITGVVMASEAALHLIRCKAVVDASGDGDVAARAGAEFQFGRPADGKPQPVSLGYVLGGVDFEAFIAYLKGNPDEVVRKRIGFQQTITPEMVEEYYQRGWPILIHGLGDAASRALAHGDLPAALGADKPFPHPHVALLPTFRNGKVVFSVTQHGGDCGFGVDATDRRQMTAALIAGFFNDPATTEIYTKYDPGFEGAYLLETAPMLGVRESRRIVGDYILTEEDVRGCRTFDDAVGINGCRLDIHTLDPDSPGLARDIGPQGWYQIPYRILLPKGVEGMLVAGRCVSTDHVAHASMRHQATGSMVTGHAAGTAAAMAAKEDTTPRCLEVQRFQALLRSQGAIIDAPQAPTTSPASV